MLWLFWNSFSKYLCQVDTVNLISIDNLMLDCYVIGIIFNIYLWNTPFNSIRCAWNIYFNFFLLFLFHLKWPTKLAGHNSWAIWHFLPSRGKVQFDISIIYKFEEENELHSGWHNVISMKNASITAYFRWKSISHFTWMPLLLHQSNSREKKTLSTHLAHICHIEWCHLNEELLYTNFNIFIG